MTENTKENHLDFELFYIGSAMMHFSSRGNGESEPAMMVHFSNRGNGESEHIGIFRYMHIGIFTAPGGSECIISVGDYVDNSFTALGSSNPREVRLEL